MYWTAVASLAASALAENLYATDYSGQVFSFSASNGSSFSLNKTQELQACGGMPSWLEFDSQTRTLYCSDESFYPNGSLSTFAAAEDGTLTQLAKITTLGGAVNSAVYGGPAGNSYIALAH